MTHKENGSSCCAAVKGHNRRRRLVVYLILAAILLALLIEISRRLLLSHSLYTLNLHSEVTLGTMPAPTKGERVVIFAPHEDDETLGCGGYLQQAVAAGAHVRVVMMTNGEYPELSLVLFEERLPINAKSFIYLGMARQKETLAAMKTLGVPTGAVTFFGYPNQYLDQMWEPDHWRSDMPVRSIRLHSSFSPYKNSFSPHVAFCGYAMLNNVETILQDEKPDVVITLHPSDIHPDHWPTGAVVRYAVQELALQGKDFAKRCQVYTYLIHRDNWPVPREYRPLAALEPPFALAKTGETTWLALPLTVSQTIDKYKATKLYHSQAPSFAPLLTSFARSNELFGVPALHTAPSFTNLSLKPFFNDPITDRVTAVQNPRADIVSASLERNGDRMLVEINTRRRVSGSYTYHLSLHMTTGNPDERVIATYSAGRKQIQGAVIHGERLQSVPSSDMTATLKGTVQLSAPWPIAGNKPAFLFVRAWSTRGKRMIDDTGEVAYRVSGEAPAPGGK